MVRNATRGREPAAVALLPSPAGLLDSTHMQPPVRRSSWPPLLALLAFLSSIAFAAAPAAAQTTPGIAVVDVERLFSDSAMAKAINEQMQGVRVETETRIQGLQKEITDLEAAIKELAPGTPRAMDMQRQLLVKQGQRQAEVQFGNARMTLIGLEGNLRVLAVVKQAVADVAQQKRIGVVLRKAPPLPANLGNRQPDEVQRMITQQVAIYAAPEFDITSDVLLRMDELHRSGATGAAPQATTNPSAGGGGTGGGQPGQR